MLPVVAEVEGKRELLAEAEAAQLGPADLDRSLGRVEVRVCVGDARAVGQDELVQMGQVPPSECEFDRLRQLPEVWVRAAAKMRPGRGQ
jgi:hypothetical protein